IILLEPGAIEISRVPARDAPKSRSSNSAQPEDEAAIFQIPLGRPKARADRADLCPNGVTNHLCQPARFDSFNFTAQKNQNLSVSTSRCGVRCGCARLRKDKFERRIL